MRAVFLLICGLAAFAVSLQAFAAPSLVSKSVVLDRFAACIAKQYPKSARDFMKTVPNTKEEAKSAKTMVESGAYCTGGRDFISMHAGQIRGSMAHALLHAEPLRSERLTNLPPVTIVRVNPDKGRIFVMRFAECIASAAPKASLELVFTERSSQSERTAAIALGEQMKACMPEGIAYPLNIPDLRNHIADALYRMSETENA